MDLSSERGLQMLVFSAEPGSPPPTVFSCSPISPSRALNPRHRDPRLLVRTDHTSHRVLMTMKNAHLGGLSVSSIRPGPDRPRLDPHARRRHRPHPGTRRVGHVEENTAADAVELTADQQAARLSPPASGARHDEGNMQSIDR